MKITKANGYKKPRYALGIAAALVAVSVSGCGSEPVDYAGDMTMPTGNVDYAGGIQMYPDPEPEIQLAGDVMVIDDSELHKTEEYCELGGSYDPDDDRLVLDGGVEFYDPEP